MTNRPVTVAVVGGDRIDCRLQDGATYADLLDAADLSPHRATALVDDRPVPADAPVPDDIDEVTVLRLVTGG